MSNNIIKSFANKSGKSEEDVERLWNKAKDIVLKDYPEIKQDNEKFYKLLTRILKKMLSIKTEENEASAISTTDIKDTYVPFTTSLKYRRKERKNITEKINNTVISLSEGYSLNSLLNEDIGYDILEGLFKQQQISSNQLKTSVTYIKLHEQNNVTFDNDDLLYLDSYIKQEHKSNNNFSKFVENYSKYLFNAESLSNNNIAYDLIKDNTLISIKSSTSNIFKEVQQNYNPITISSVILSLLERYDTNLFTLLKNKAGVLHFLEYKDIILNLATESKNNIIFSISYINENNEFITKNTNTISELVLIERCINNIENNIGGTKKRLFSTYKQIAELYGDNITTIKLLDESTYNILRENIIKNLLNIKSVKTLKKLEKLLK